MVAGVPGTGIGGLYYVLLAAWMPIKELRRTFSGRSSLARWRFVLFQVSLAAAIIAALWGEYVLIDRGFTYVCGHARAGTWAHRLGSTGAGAVAPVLTIVPFLVLGGVMVSLHVLRLAIRPRAVRPPASLPDSEAPRLLDPAEEL